MNEHTLSYDEIWYVIDDCKCSWECPSNVTEAMICYSVYVIDKCYLFCDYRESYDIRYDWWYVHDILMPVTCVWLSFPSRGGTLYHA